MHFTCPLLLLAVSTVLAAPAPEPQAYAAQSVHDSIERVGDGSPHQWYLYKQVVKPVDCNKGPCEIAKMEGESVGVSWGATAGGEWGSAGFSVSKERQTGEVPNCQSDESNTKKLCVWSRTAYTAYQVEKWAVQNGKRKWKQGNEYTIWSPNANDVGSGWVCGRDSECADKGAEKWGKARYNGGVKGGPQPYPFDEPEW